MKSTVHLSSFRFQVFQHCWLGKLKSNLQLCNLQSTVQVLEVWVLHVRVESNCVGLESKSNKIGTRVRVPVGSILSGIRYMALEVIIVVFVLPTSVCVHVPLNPHSSLLQFFLGVRPLCGILSYYLIAIVRLWNIYKTYCTTYYIHPG